MKTFNYTVKTTYGEAFGTLPSKSEKTARDTLVKQYAGELADEDGNPLNNEVESIELQELHE
jgi:hypothetical protein